MTSQTADLVLASRPRRLTATGIDLLLAALTLMPFILRGLGGQARELSTHGALALAMLFVWQWSSVATSGQTFGKRLLGLKIVLTNGRAVDKISGVVLRSWIFYSVVPWPGILGAIFILDSLFILNGDRRCLHDYLAGTMVVDIRPPGRNRFG